MTATVNDIKDRCRIEDGHWYWAGATSDGYTRISAPDFTIHGGKMTSQHGRRAMWHVMHRKAIPAGWRVFGTCDEKTCVNPAHLVCQPVAERGKEVAASGREKGSVRRITAIRASARKRSHLTEELIDLILTSDKSGRELMEETGLGRSVISKVRKGHATAFTPVGGLFSGLLAANDDRRRAA